MLHLDRTRLVILALVVLGGLAGAQTTRPRSPEELRGSITPERAWWDLRHYELAIEVMPETRSIRGENRISFLPLESGRTMQIDLQPPLRITRVTRGDRELAFETEGNVTWVRFPEAPAIGEETSLVVRYEGQPRESRNPPWSGGFSWTEDSKGRPFIATTCQGIGASIWWPVKDHGYDEPDRGMLLHATVPAALTAVANGRLKSVATAEDGKTRTFSWEVLNPINSYGVNLNIADYESWDEVHAGESGPLDLQYWVLPEDRKRAEKQFVELPRVIEAFEYWFGPYPFPQDGFKLVQVPYLGMEHQSSVTYGNGFRNGYRGRDLSGTGVGLKFDFIIVHESAHEWFGNNVSMQDAADMWIHEGFANYAESLFVEYHFSRKEADDYVIGTRRNIRNDRPIIGEYGLNRAGSGDMYYKGGNMLHTLRQVVDNDVKWRRLLRGLNSTFRHRTVTTQEIEDHIAAETGLDLGAFFDQYLRTTDVPLLEYRITGGAVGYRWAEVVPGFAMPIRVHVNGEVHLLVPRAELQLLQLEEAVESFHPDRNYYVRSRKL